MYILIPIPLFIDVANLSFFYIEIQDYNYLTDSPKIPLPIGAIAFLLATLIGYLGSVFFPKYFRSVLPFPKLILFYCFVVLPISLYGIFVSNLSVPRLLQILLPMAFISLLSFPTLVKDRIDLVKRIFLGGFIFFNLHFFSIITTSENFLKVNDRQEFSSFFGILIYQGLVTYPAVISLHLFLTIAIIYVGRKEVHAELKRYKYVAYYFIFILLYLLAASGRRAFLIEYLAAFVIVVTFAISYSIKLRFVKKKSIWYFALFIILFILFFTFYINTPLSDRVIVSIENNTFDSGRVGILNYALDFYSNNLPILLIGGGPKDAPGFHNFILDQIYRIGIIGLLSVYLTMALLIKRFVKTTDLGTAYTQQRRMFLFILLCSLFLQSMINASVSQPYYFVNFLAVTILMFFVLFTQDTTKLNSPIN